ncbi:MAG: nucleoside phosphorylase [Bacteroidales bacterium]|nr:nucleoside phosphorylase [Bacteroidales bacterium]
MKEIKKAELVLNAGGKIYHLNLSPGEVAETILLVGDPGRAKIVADFFDTVELESSNREINTFTGTYKGKRLSVVSTGMGTDNIEIVVSELDALFNIDFNTREPRELLTSLNLIRIGTSGALQKDIPVEYSYLASAYGLGLDGLAYFYEDGPFVMDREFTASFINQLEWDENLPRPYAMKASSFLLDKLAPGYRKGITLTAPGFYAPQGRELRLNVMDKTITERASRFEYDGEQVTNFEMETSALYLLSAMLGHEALTVCNIIANRVTGAFDPDYKKSMKRLIGEILERVAEI